MYQPTITKTWEFTSAQTDFQLEAVGSTQRMVPISASVTAGNSNTGDVSVTLGLATATLPTITANSATGASGVFFRHAGIAKGGGAVRDNGGAALCIGDVDADLRLTCSAATGGALSVTVQYRMLEDQ